LKQGNCWQRIGLGISSVLASSLGSLMGNEVQGQQLTVMPGCLGDYGTTGCAALIYSHMVCDPAHASVPQPQLSLQLDEAFKEAGLRADDLQVDEVVSTALGRFIPKLCPELILPLQGLRN
jgi:hypothetical protein